MTRILTTLIALLVASAPSLAQEFNRIQAEDSRIGFTYRQMGVSVDGHFGRFTGELNFDPARPKDARVRIEVDLSSIDTGTEDGDEEAAGKTWFHMAAFPSAVFESSGVTVLDDDQFEVQGSLSIKGISRKITAPARFEREGDQAIFSGSFTLLRNDFSIGEGVWARHGVLANEVIVRFRMLAQNN